MLSHKKTLEDPLQKIKKGCYIFFVKVNHTAAMSNSRSIL
jgi:hypothetical protein